MRYHVYDEDVLHTTSGNFDIQAEVPEELNIPNNPDGTVPQMTATFEGETLYDSTTVAALIGRNKEHLVDLVLKAAAERLKLPNPLNDARFDDLHAASLEGVDLDTTEDEELIGEFQQFFHNYIGWESLSINLSAATEDEPDKKCDLRLSIYAPGYAAILSMLSYVTEGETLTNMIAARMPLDEYYHGEDANW